MKCKICGEDLGDIAWCPECRDRYGIGWQDE